MYLDCEYSENIYPTIFPLYGVCTQGFIQNFSVGVGKHRATPSRGVWADAPPVNLRNLHALRLLLVACGGPKWLEITTNELLSIKKNVNFKILAGGDPSAPPPPPLYDTLSAYMRMVTRDMTHILLFLVQLFIFNFYPFLQRYLQPHQKGRASDYII